MLLFDTELVKLASIIDKKGARLYAVGGFVRSYILGIPYSDIDLCSFVAPLDLANILETHGIKYHLSAPELGTIIILVGDKSYEHTTFRMDEYPEGGAHRPRSISPASTIKDDALRRDFTANALYADILSGEIIDPLIGERDIKKRVLRAHSPEKIMRDDGLRVMRLARFACELGFNIEKKTFKAAKDYAKGLEDISYERKRDELIKILMSDIKYPALTSQYQSPVLYGLHLLHDLGVYPYLLPELIKCQGIKQQSRFHAYDVLEHNFHTCAATPATLELRLAGLLHDIGKPLALIKNCLPPDAGAVNDRQELKGIQKTPMLGHDTLGAEAAELALKRLRFPTATIDTVCFLIKNHMYDLQAKAKESKLRTRFSMFGYEKSLLLCSLREADILGSGRCNAYSIFSWRDTLQKMRNENAPFSLSELNCTGSDIMQWLDLSPGKHVGDVLESLLRHCARFPADNTNSRLKKLAPGIYHGLSGR